MVATKAALDEGKSIDFLIREYDMLRDMRKELVHIQEVRLSVFLTAVVVGISGLGASAQMYDRMLQYRYLIPFILGLFTVCLLLFGIITFFRMIERSIEVIVATRGMNLIRAYFVERNEEIKNYLIFAGYKGDEPPFASVGFLSGRSALLIGLPQIVAILNSFMCSIYLAVLIRSLFSEPTLWAISISMICFVIAWLLQYIYYRNRMAKMGKKFSRPT